VAKVKADLLWRERCPSVTTKVRWTAGRWLEGVEHTSPTRWEGQIGFDVPEWRLMVRAEKAGFEPAEQTCVVTRDDPVLHGALDALAFNDEANLPRAAQGKRTIRLELRPATQPARSDAGPPPSPPGPAAAPQ
jgi:hypothetical protein